MLTGREGEEIEMHDAGTPVRRTRVVAGAALAAILLGIGPATASAAVSERPSYGELLSSHSQSVPGGVLKVTEYRDRTEVVGRIASCSVDGSASKPTLSSGRLSSLVKWKVTGCANTVKLTHIIGDISSGTRLDLARWDGTRKAPTHTVHGLTRSCARGSIVSVLTISLDAFEYSYFESLPLRVTRC